MKCTRGKWKDVSDAVFEDSLNFFFWWALQNFSQKPSLLTLQKTMNKD